MGNDGPPASDTLRRVPVPRHAPPADLGTLSGTASVTLAARPESVRRARDFTRDTLNGWRMTDRFDAVALVVSELVTNALRHGLGVLPPVPVAAAPGTGGAAVELELMRCARRLVCAVQDPDGRPPRVGELDGVTECGRGLHLVDCFSDGWGWRPLSGSRTGKVVWAVFRTA
ncbi:ATP-binding protein [Streptomyces sp. RFCAC02]|uniref:ATP-binding protein n=1 Tax=Streptomyces sp. RFCAC02 TaxID=2499143 RepID=UPI00101EE95C|nr:ATP-binding protein [Streptomyces sp. RFCAC02]